MKNNGGKIIGICIIILGFVLLGNYLSIWDLNIFFDGWWTLLVIVPSFVCLFTKKEKVTYLILLLFGLLMLLDENDLIGDVNIWSIIFAVIIINIGLNIAFKNKTTRSDDKKICAIFGAAEEKINKEDFKINNLVAVFGGIELDLRDANIKDETTIEATSIFGGIDIFVPNDVKVKVNGVNIFGGVENKSIGNKKTLNINSTCIFGGIDIK